MEKLIVDAEGKITIPPRILEKRGLHPGGKLILVEAAEGLLVYQGGVASLTARWWNGLSDDERRRAETEAQCYENLSAAERDHIWNEEAESIEDTSLSRSSDCLP